MTLEMQQAVYIYTSMYTHNTYIHENIHTHILYNT